MRDLGVIIAEVVESELVDEDYLMKVEVVVDGGLLEDPTHFSVYHQLGFDHQA